eukprot:jgi/Tetstr1/441153/TSEL_029413.t1
MAGDIIKQHNTNAVKNLAATQASLGDNVDEGSSPEPPAKGAKPAKPAVGKNAWMDGDLYHYWVETVFLPYTEELRRTGKILLIIDNFSGHTRVIAAECALTATLSAEESPNNPTHATLQGALKAAAGGQPQPKLLKKVTPATLQRAGAALETTAKAEEKKEQQVNKAQEEVANAKCRKTELAEAVAEAELSVLGAHVKVADAKIAAGQDSSARERQDARDEMSVFDSNDSEEGEDEIEEEEKDGEHGEDELNPCLHR